MLRKISILSLLLMLTVSNALDSEKTDSNSNQKSPKIVDTSITKVSEAQTTIPRAPSSSADSRETSPSSKEPPTASSSTDPTEAVSSATATTTTSSSSASSSTTTPSAAPTGVSLKKSLSDLALRFRTTADAVGSSESRVDSIFGNGSDNSSDNHSVTSSDRAHIISATSAFPFHYLTSDDLREFEQDFFKNPYSKYIGQTEREVIVASAANLITQFRTLAHKFGVNRIIPPTGSSEEEIYEIDISWPSVKAYVERYLSEHGVTEATPIDKLFHKVPEGAVNYFCYIDRTELKGIFDIIKNISHKADNLSETDISDETLERWNLIIQTLFTINFKDPSQNQSNIDKFKKTIDNISKNYTGFQKLASFLMIYIIEMEDHRSDYEDTRITITPNKKSQAHSYLPQGGTRSYGIDIDFDLDDSEFEYTFCHELSHLFHSLLLNLIFGDVSKDLACLNYSIFNSKSVDLLYAIYPWLSQTDTIASDIKKIIMDNQDLFSEGKNFKEGILKIIKEAMLLGLNNLCSLNIDVMVESLPELNEQEVEQLAHIICVKSLIKRNPWTDLRELFNILGIIPLKIGNKLFLLTDRNTELIYRKRQKAWLTDDNTTANTYTSEAEINLYRFHRFRNGITLPLNLILINIAYSIAFLSGDHEAFHKIAGPVCGSLARANLEFYPAGLLHLENLGFSRVRVEPHLLFQTASEPAVLSASLPSSSSAAATTADALPPSPPLQTPSTTPETSLLTSSSSQAAE